MNAAMTYQTRCEASASENNREKGNALPRVLTNPITKDTMRLLNSSEETGGASVRFEFTLPPHTEGTPLHYHASLSETFEVVDGTLGMRAGVGNIKRLLKPGERMEIPARLPHRFWNPSGSPVTFVTEVRPAARFERFIRSMYGLAIDGKTDAKGMPKNLLYLALVLEDADFYFAGAPHGLQRVLLGCVTGIARRFRADRDLNRYYSVEI